jgi:hypothetical protein
VAQGHPVEPLRATAEQTGRLHRVVPSLVVELDVDMAFEQHRWRHPARLGRVRRDLEADDFKRCDPA